MIYVERDGDGEITSLHASSISGGHEALAAEDPEVREFLARTGNESEIARALRVSDLEFVRVLEDLVTSLINKNVIMLTDLPEAAQHKILSRRGLRCRLSELGDIIAEADDLVLP